MKYSWEEIWGNINRKETALSFVVCMLLGVGYLNIFLPEGKIISDIITARVMWIIAAALGGSSAQTPNTGFFHSILWFLFLGLMFHIFGFYM